MTTKVITYISTLSGIHGTQYRMQGTNIVQHTGLFKLDIFQSNLSARVNIFPGIIRNNKIQLLYILVSCLEGDPLLWIWPLYLHVNQKSDDDDDDDDEVGLSKVQTPIRFLLRISLIRVCTVCHTNSGQYLLLCWP